MLRRFLLASKSCSSVGGAFSTTVFTLAPKRPAAKTVNDGKVSEPKLRSVSTKKLREASTAKLASDETEPLLRAQREGASKKTQKTAARVEEERLYKHWYRHTYGVGDRRDSWAAYPYANPTTLHSNAELPLAPHHSPRPSSPRVPHHHAPRSYARRAHAADPYTSLTNSMGIQRCPERVSDILTVVAGKEYARNSSADTAYGGRHVDDEELDLDLAPQRRKENTRRLAKRRAKAKARAYAKSIAAADNLLAARRGHNADHAHWFKHTYCLPDWDVVLVGALLAPASASSSANSAEAIALLMNIPPAASCALATGQAHLASNSSTGRDAPQNNLYDLSRAARSNVEMSMLLQRIQNVVADPQDATARILFNLH